MKTPTKAKLSKNELTDIGVGEFLKYQMKTLITILCIGIVSSTAFAQTETRQTQADSVILFQQLGKMQERLQRTYHTSSDSLFFGISETTVENRKKVYYYVTVKTKADLLIFRKFHPRIKISANILSKIK